MQSGWRRLREPSGGAGLHSQCLTCVFKKDIPDSCVEKIVERTCENRKTK